MPVEAESLDSDVNMDHRQERMRVECRKVIDSINSMSFTNLDDQRVHSLMMIREIARGVVNNRVEKVTKSDVKKALSCSIEKMVVSCRDVNNILGRIPCDGMDDQQSFSVSRMKEIVSQIVNKRARVAITRHHDAAESVDGIDPLTMGSEVDGAFLEDSKDALFDGIQRRLFPDEQLDEEAVIRNEDGQNERQGNGDFQIEVEQNMVLDDRHLAVEVVPGYDDGQSELRGSIAGEAIDACSDMHVGQEEGMLIKDVEVVVDVDIGIEDCQNELQESLVGVNETYNEDTQMGEAQTKDAEAFETCKEDAHMVEKERIYGGTSETCNEDAQIGKEQRKDEVASETQNEDAQMGEARRIDVGASETLDEGALIGEGQRKDNGASETGNADATTGEAQKKNEGASETSNEDNHIGKKQRKDDGASKTREEVANTELSQGKDGAASEIHKEDAHIEVTQAKDGGVSETRNEDAQAGEVQNKDDKASEICNKDARTEELPTNNVRVSEACNEDTNIEEEQMEDELQDMEVESRNEDGPNEEQKSTSLSPLRLSLMWPPDDKLTLEWVKDMMFALERSSKKDSPSEFWSLMPIALVDKLINTASSILSEEPNCVKVDCRGDDSRVIVVGDIHGQFHDLLNIFNLAGLPSDNQFYVFNGDYVDRGAWGLEVFLVLLAWKVLMPNRVYLLRGNHETKYCTSAYGFEQEVKIKYGDQGDIVYNKCLECFKELPLASIVASCVFTCHGGLFRSEPLAPLRRSKRKRTQKLELGSLEELSKTKRSLVDAPDEGSSVILTDVLWSDPSKEVGIVENEDRGMGLSWGPDCTEAFLKQSKLKLIIRSHEGPDARAGQDKFGDMLIGYTLDHVGESGKLYTLFSAPDYPQFGETRYFNEGAYAVLKPPNLEIPSFHSFKAAERPKVDPYNAADDKDVYTGKQDLTSMAETKFPARKRSSVDFEALGIFNPPSWSVQLSDGGGTKAVEVPRAPVGSVLEGLPLPNDLQEPHKAAYGYFLELIAGLKHMVSTRVVEKEALEPADKQIVQQENEVPNSSVVSKPAGEQIFQQENEGPNNSVELKPADEQMVQQENEGSNTDEQMVLQENEGPNTMVNSKPSDEQMAQQENEGPNTIVDSKPADEQIVQQENEGPNTIVDSKPADEQIVQHEHEGPNNSVDSNPADEQIIQKENENNLVDLKPADGQIVQQEGEGPTNSVDAKPADEQIIQKENEGPTDLLDSKTADEQIVQLENEGPNNSVDSKPAEQMQEDATS